MAEFIASHLIEAIYKSVQENVTFDDCAHVTGTLFVTVDNQQTFDCVVNEHITNVSYSSSGVSSSHFCFNTKIEETGINEVIDEGSNVDFYPDEKPEIEMKEFHNIHYSNLHSGLSSYGHGSCTEPEDISSILTEYKKAGKPDPQTNNVCDGKYNHVDEDMAKAHSDTLNQSDLSVVNLKFRKSLKTHKTHSVSHQKYVCEHCGKEFLTVSNYKAHQTVHSDERPFKCGICQKAFKSKAMLNAHTLNIHLEINKSLCTLCGKICSSKRALENHMRFHTGDMFKCTRCEKEFSSKGQLKEHELSHGPKRFACKECDKRFATKSNLNDHIKTHGEKTFACEICPKAFVSRSQLKFHVKVHHSDNKPFRCDSCGERFALNCLLKKHGIFCSGEKPFSCDLCDKSFARKQALVAHNKKQHMQSEKAFKCSICQKQFIWQYLLKQHEKTHLETVLAKEGESRLRW